MILTGEARAKAPIMVRVMGRAVDRLAGRYITAENVGSTVADMDEIASHADRQRPVRRGGRPLPVTARGVLLSLEAAVRHRHGRDLRRVHVAVKGFGNVGRALASMLHAAEARLTVADLDAGRSRRRAMRTDRPPPRSKRFRRPKPESSPLAPSSAT